MGRYKGHYHKCSRCHKTTTYDLTLKEIKQLKTEKFCNCLDEETRYSIPDTPHFRSRLSIPDQTGQDPLFDLSIAALMKA